MVGVGEPPGLVELRSRHRDALTQAVPGADPAWLGLHGQAFAATVAGRLADADRLLRGAPAAEQWQVAAMRWDAGRAFELGKALIAAVAAEPEDTDRRAVLALALADGGLLGEARGVLNEITGRSSLSSSCWAVAAHAAVEADTQPVAAALLKRAPNLGADALVVSATGFWGCLGHLQGALTLVTGRPGDAATMLERAGAAYTRLEAPVWQARAGYLEARARAALGDRAGALELVARAWPLAREAGAATVARRALTLLQRERAAEALSRNPLGLGVRGLDRASEQRDDHALEPAPGPPPSARLLRRGDLWDLSCGARSVYLHDGKGVRYLARLMAAPDREIHALELLAGGARGEAAATTASREVGIQAAESGVGPLLDEQARRAYTARLAHLEEEIARAERVGERTRASRAREERDALSGELGRAVGLAGRLREGPSDAERARMNVSRALRRVIAEVQEKDPVLGEHLEHAVSTGMFCGYLTRTAETVARG